MVVWKGKILLDVNIVRGKIWSGPSFFMAFGYLNSDELEEAGTKKNLMTKPLKIETCSFGRIVIDGKQYTSDLIIYPDGHIAVSWWRRSGHKLSADDISPLIESEPEVIIAGTGVNGLMRPVKGLDEMLSKKGIEFISAPNQEAVELFNELSSAKRIGACFHLTC